MLVTILLLVTFLIFVFGVMRWPTPRSFFYSYKLQGPWGWPFIGNALSLSNLKEHDILDYFQQLFKKYPRYTSIWVLGLNTVFLHEAEDLEVVLSSTAHIQKGLEYGPLIPWLKEGLLTSTGQKWHKRRKMLTPAFFFRVLDDSLYALNRNANVLAYKILNSKMQPVDIESVVKLCTLDIICESAMGVRLGVQSDEGKEYMNAIRRVCEIIIKRELSFWLYRDWMFNLSPTGFEFRKLLKYLNNFADKVISERRKSFKRTDAWNSNKDLNIKKRLAFLDIMIEYEIQNPNSLSENDIREEVETFMFEGHDTTSSAITFTLFLLGIHQEIQDKVVAELNEIYGDSDRHVEMKDLGRMSYLERVIKETMRLYPPVPYLSRTLNDDLRLGSNNSGGEVMIPAGVNLAILPYTVHRNPRFFPDPEVFDPDRFSEKLSQQRHPFAFIPFSAGPRNCIGQKFAMMEIKVVISTILRKARLESITKLEDVRLLSLLVLRPHIPIMIRVTPRDTMKLRVRYY